MIRKLAIAGAICFHLPANASVSLPMSCDLSVRDFFAPLVQQNLISTKPYNVEETSVNHFRPKLFAELTVYGMPVDSVFGYADEPLLFVKRGPRNNEVYGVIVREGIANVQAQLKSVGAIKALTFRVDSHSTVIACKGNPL